MIIKWLVFSYRSLTAFEPKAAVNTSNTYTGFFQKSIDDATDRSIWFFSPDPTAGCQSTSRDEKRSRVRTSKDVWIRNVRGERGARKFDSLYFIDPP